jgi:hypothetical protein
MSITRYISGWGGGGAYVKQGPIYRIVFSILEVSGSVLNAETVHYTGVSLQLFLLVTSHKVAIILLQVTTKSVLSVTPAARLLEPTIPCQACLESTLGKCLKESNRHKTEMCVADGSDPSALSCYHKRSDGSYTPTGKNQTERPYRCNRGL